MVGSVERAPLSFGAAMLGVAVAIVAIAMMRDPKSLDALEPRPSRTTNEAPAAQKPGGGAEPVIIKEPSKQASDTQLEEANSIAEIEALAKTHPTDGRVLAKLVRAQAVQPDGTHAAIGSLRRLAQLDQKAAAEPDFQTLIKRAASGPPETSALALDTMAGSLGSTGVDLLYELAISPGVAKKVRDEAMLMTRRDEVKKLASPALKVALDLRDVNGCERQKLFDTVQKVGDARSLQYLVVLQARKGCGVFSLGDCYSCLGNRVSLNKTIAAVKDRKGQ